MTVLTLEDGRPVEMALPRKIAMSDVRGLESPINLHLLKLLAFDAPPRVRANWKHEIRAWLIRIAIIRVKPERRMLPRKTLFDWLYLERFEGLEEEATQALLRALEYELPNRNGRSPAEIAERLRAFHEAAATALARGEAPTELLDAL